ncbi:hypothetical protein EXU57_24850 [Segetibacter sp. 3557_3]|uniref:hypothetical protein n=1 Tax=Segetibacter sp. 3557_3 TaxID=2547429 RepID=UPI001058579D|nr:hypothetical protein [Segetibacter sp. 3557_3]TDH17789.1 hypothetical protein EXU57_24850 [Segetibacter sp. 3557_3]
MEISLDPLHDIVNALALHSSRIYAAGTGNGLVLAAFKNDGLPLACSNDELSPIIKIKDVTVTLDATGYATIQPSDVIQSVTDNWAVNNASYEASAITYKTSIVGLALPPCHAYIILKHAEDFATPERN